ncbi:hypothetical protein D3C72_1232900 [compost metagenome]
MRHLAGERESIARADQVDVVAEHQFELPFEHVANFLALVLDLPVAGLAGPDDVDVGLQQAATLGQHHAFERHAAGPDDRAFTMPQDRRLVWLLVAGQRADIGVQRYGQPVQRGKRRGGQPALNL